MVKITPLQEPSTLTMSSSSTRSVTPHSPWFWLALELVSLSLLGESSPTCFGRFLPSGSMPTTAGSLPFQNTSSRGFKVGCWDSSQGHHDLMPHIAEMLCHSAEIFNQVFFFC